MSFYKEDMKQYVKNEDTQVIKSEPQDASDEIKIESERCDSLETKIEFDDQNTNNFKHEEEKYSLVCTTDEIEARAYLQFANMNIEQEAVHNETNSAEKFEHHEMLSKVKEECEEYNDFEYKFLQPEAEHIEVKVEIESLSQLKTESEVPSDMCIVDTQEESNVDEHSNAEGVGNYNVIVNLKDEHFICKACNNAFTDEDKLSSHICSETKICLLKCNICDKSFTVKGKFNRHMRTHLRQRPFNCHICSKTFADKNNFEKHRSTHNGVRPYKCDICDMTFLTKENFERHSSSHTRERPFKCKLCDKSFLRKNNVTRHMRSHTGEKPFACDSCKKSFAHKSDLTVHMRSHTGERPYSCQFCDKSFCDKSKLNIHTRVHTGERPYKCSFCKLSFSHTSNLSTHMRLHTGELPYKCNMCSKAYPVRNKLNKHILAHTKKNSTILQNY